MKPCLLEANTVHCGGLECVGSLLATPDRIRTQIRVPKVKITVNSPVQKFALENLYILYSPRLGGNFGPEKKIYPPPPKNFPADTLPALPPPFPPGRPPLFGIFNQNRPPPFLAPRTTPPPPRRTKIKNIRNVHQAEYFSV